jgi:hypothetical protein
VFGRLRLSDASTPIKTIIRDALHSFVCDGDTCPVMDPTPPRQPRAARRGRGLLLTLAGLVVASLLVGGGLAVVTFLDTGQGAREQRADAESDRNGPGGVGDGPAGAASAGQSASSTSGNPGGGAASGGAVVMPDVLGLNAAAALADLRTLGIKDVRLVSEYADGRTVDNPAQWTVVKQSTAPGSGVDAATVVVLTCVRGY